MSSPMDTVTESEMAIAMAVSSIELMIKSKDENMDEIVSCRVLLYFS